MSLKVCFEEPSVLVTDAKFCGVEILKVNVYIRTLLMSLHYTWISLVYLVTPMQAHKNLSLFF